MASGRRARGKAGPTVRRRRGKKDAPRITEMTPEIWEAYHRGTITVFDADERRMAQIPDGAVVTKDQIGLNGLDWDDPLYRKAYVRFTILVDDEDPDDPPEMKVYRVGRGRNDYSVNVVLEHLEDRRELEILEIYTEERGFARVRATEERIGYVRKFGCAVVEEPDHEEKAFAVTPGSRTPLELTEFLRRFNRKWFTVRIPFDEGRNSAVVIMERSRASEFTRRGFTAEEIDLDRRIPFMTGL